MNEETRTLFVLWQCWRTRQFVPVARLLTRTGGGAPFELAYVRGVERAISLGFQPFVAFPSVGEVYRSSTLFPFSSSATASSRAPGRTMRRTWSRSVWARAPM